MVYLIKHDFLSMGWCTTFTTFFDTFYYPATGDQVEGDVTMLVYTNTEEQLREKMLEVIELVGEIAETYQR